MTITVHDVVTACVSHFYTRTETLCCGTAGVARHIGLLSPYKGEAFAVLIGSS